MGIGPDPTPRIDSPPLILASGSPQRRAILAGLGVSFTVCPSGAAEIESGDPRKVALENALRKARAAREARAAELPAGTVLAEAVLGVDTLVTLDGVIYGKPADEAEARATLRALCGSTHEVISGLALLLPGGVERTGLESTRVSFHELSEEELEAVLAHGEWRDRSGGYAIQGASGRVLAREVEGDWENVVGLPVAALRALYPELFGAGAEDSAREIG
ncbi:MAG TPA: nucleoside triphosphate pyrophosphatase [Solirubrobacteraceae bacterium]|jgi:septum formation protein|nr:nucleoside triphosphate pyrophosphatase [Solirubrobacteraceae bacterium]